MPAEAPQTASPEKEPTATPELDLLFEQAKNCEDLSFVAEHLALYPNFVLKKIVQFLQTGPDKERQSAVISLISTLFSNLEILPDFETLMLITELMLQLKTIAPSQAKALSYIFINFTQSFNFSEKPIHQIALLGSHYYNFFEIEKNKFIVQELSKRLQTQSEYRDFIYFLCSIPDLKYLTQLVNELPFPSSLPVADYNKFIDIFIRNYKDSVAYAFVEKMAASGVDLGQHFVTRLIEVSQLDTAVTFLSEYPHTLSALELVKIMRAYNEGDLCINSGLLRTNLLDQAQVLYKSATISSFERKELYSVLLPDLSMEEVRNTLTPDCTEDDLCTFASTSIRSVCEVEKSLFFLNQLTNKSYFIDAISLLRNYDDLVTFSEIISSTNSDVSKIRKMLLESYISLCWKQINSRITGQTPEQLNAFFAHLVPKIPFELQLFAVSEFISQSFKAPEAQLSGSNKDLILGMLHKTIPTAENFSELVTILEGFVFYASEDAQYFKTWDTEFLPLITQGCSAETSLKLQILARHFGWDEVIKKLDETAPLKPTPDELTANIRELALLGELRNYRDIFDLLHPDDFVNEYLPVLCRYADDADIALILETFIGSDEDNLTLIINVCMYFHKYELLYTYFKSLTFYSQLDLVRIALEKDTITVIELDALIYFCEANSQRLSDSLDSSDWLRINRVMKNLSLQKQEQIQTALTKTRSGWLYLIAARIEDGEKVSTEQLSEQQKELLYAIGLANFTEENFAYLHPNHGFTLASDVQNSLFFQLQAKCDAVIDQLRTRPHEIRTFPINIETLAEEFQKQNKYTLTDVAVALYKQNPNNKDFEWTKLRKLITVLGSTVDPFSVHYASPAILNEKYADLLPEEYLEVINDPNVPIRQLCTRWDENKFAHTKVFVSNIERILALGKAPGKDRYRAVELFYSNGIANFARYPLEVLTDLMGSAQNPKKVALIVATSDHNGAFYQDESLIRDMSDQLAAKGIALTIFEAFQPLRTIKQLAETTTITGEKIQGLIVMAHGSTDGFNLSDAPGGKVLVSHLTTGHPTKPSRLTWPEFAQSVEGQIQKKPWERGRAFPNRIRRAAKREQLLQHLTNDILTHACPVLYLSCSTGVENGPSQITSLRTGGTAIGPSADSHTKKVTITEDPESGALSFSPQYASSKHDVKTMVYTNGTLMST